MKRAERRLGRQHSVRAGLPMPLRFCSKQEPALEDRQTGNRVSNQSEIWNVVMRVTESDHQCDETEMNGDSAGDGYGMLVFFPPGRHEIAEEEVIRDQYVSLDGPLGIVDSSRHEHS